MTFAPLSSPAPWPPSGLGLTGLPRSRSGVPHPGQVIGRSRQRHLDRHFLQSSASELPHPTLLFQYAEDRFNQSLASPIGRAPAGYAASAACVGARDAELGLASVRRGSAPAPSSNPVRKHPPPVSPTLARGPEQRNHCRH